MVLDASGASNAYSKHGQLCSSGIPLKTENWGGKSHSKWAVADAGFASAAALFGSINWTASTLRTRTVGPPKPGTLPSGASIGTDGARLISVNDASVGDGRRRLGWLPAGTAGDERTSIGGDHEHVVAQGRVPSVRAENGDIVDEDGGKTEPDRRECAPTPADPSPCERREWRRRTTRSTSAQARPRVTIEPGPLDLRLLLMRRIGFSGVWAVVLASSMALQACSASETPAKVRSVTDELETNTNWEQFRFTARHTGHNPYESALTAATVASAHVLYQVNLPSSALMQHDEHLFVRTGSEGLQARNAANGLPLWSAGDILSQTQAFNAGQVFAAGDNDVMGYRTSDGSVTHAFGPPAFDFAVSNPTTRNDFVYVVAGSNENTSSFGFVHGQRIKGTGAPSFDANLSFRTSLDPAVANGHLLVTGSGHTVELDALTGATIWQASVGSALFGPAISSGRVLIETSSELLALDEHTGAVLWSSPLAAAPAGNLVVTAERVYVPSATATGTTIRAFSVATGGGLFSAAVGTARLSGNLAGAEDLLWLGEADGKLYATSLADGSVLASFDLSGSGGATPIVDSIVANGRVYAANTQATFAIGLEPPIPRPRWMPTAQACQCSTSVTTASS